MPLHFVIALSVTKIILIEMYYTLLIRVLSLLIFDVNLRWFLLTLFVTSAGPAGLIFAGHVLKDENTLAAHNIKDSGIAVNMVRAAPKKPEPVAEAEVFRFTAQSENKDDMV